MDKYTGGPIFNIKFYPMALNSKEMYKIYRREQSFIGRLINTIDHYLKRSLM